MKIKFLHDVGAPLFMLMRNAQKNKGQTPIQALFENAFVRHADGAYCFRAERVPNSYVTDAVLERILREKPMLADDFIELSYRVSKRYGSKPRHHGGAFVFYFDRDKNFISSINIFVSGRIFSTEYIRLDARKKYSKSKSATKEFIDTQVLLAEFSAIERMSRKGKVEWETKLPKLEHLAM